MMSARRRHDAAPDRVHRVLDRDYRALDRDYRALDELPATGPVVAMSPPVVGRSRDVVAMSNHPDPQYPRAITELVVAVDTKIPHPLHARQRSVGV